MPIIDIELDPEESEVDALALIDQTLADINHASIVDADRMRDALLDIRQALTRGR